MLTPNQTFDQVLDPTSNNEKLDWRKIRSIAAIWVSRSRIGDHQRVAWCWLLLKLYYS